MLVANFQLESIAIYQREIGRAARHHGCQKVVTFSKFNVSKQAFELSKKLTRIFEMQACKARDEDVGGDDGEEQR